MIMSAGMLISLRGVKGVQEETMLFSGHYKIMVSFQVALEEIMSQIKHEPCLHWFLSNFLTSIPHHFCNHLCPGLKASID